MVQVSEIEFESNPKKYYSMVSFQDIAIVSGGKEVIAVLTSPSKRHSIIDELAGILPSEDIDIKAIRREKYK
ncbi:MAG: hypothetical protein LBS91_02065 [Clostridiales Family XIII bacterium]|nr:hypothetical protein [Clostridiales Family XIII bacterium]